MKKKNYKHCSFKERIFNNKKNKVKEIDPRAFIWVSFVNEVLGEGFSE